MYLCDRKCFCSLRTSPRPDIHTGPSQLQYAESRCNLPTSPRLWCWGINKLSGQWKVFISEHQDEGYGMPRDFPAKLTSSPTCFMHIWTMLVRPAGLAAWDLYCVRTMTMKASVHVMGLTLLDKSGRVSHCQAKFLMIIRLKWIVL